ncbi:DUF7260 family protein [Halorubrum tebenquichense]|uniref:DUF7260 domain-containing protein n=1 Tax=Halorubrum tebenquichense DSM 14210 TaxID=1227485 RepID=M0DTJ9_9EURY|nr:hypothetical protein [Halorubrum tebenquichense]ELZ38820.1 hypothetical protein C472_06220 [Halorubrum tebenquichense DSM 14210]
MSVETHVDRARDRVAAERDAVADERRAYERFGSAVASIPTTSGPTAAGGEPTAGTGPGTGGVRAAVGGRTASATDGCRRVREAFAETVRPHSVADRAADEPLLATVREELGDAVAVALSPKTDHDFTPPVASAIGSAVDDRIAEIAVFDRTLEREAASLRSAGETVRELTDWLAAADETPLLTLGFDELRRRHEALADRIATCESLLADRQADLDRTASRGASVGLRQRSTVAYLYDDFPVSHPVLSTVARLVETLTECQRAVRDHLTRRA